MAGKKEKEEIENENDFQLILGLCCSIFEWRCSRPAPLHL